VQLPLQDTPSGSVQREPSSEPFVNSVRFDGNRRNRSEDLAARIFTRPGDPYNEEGLQHDVKALWNSQFFDDIRLEVQDTPGNAGAKIVIFHVRERPIIRQIDYVGFKSISKPEILNRFKELNVRLLFETPLDPNEVLKAETVLQELLAEHRQVNAVV